MKLYIAIKSIYTGPNQIKCFQHKSQAVKWLAGTKYASIQEYTL